MWRVLSLVASVESGVEFDKSLVDGARVFVCYVCITHYLWSVVLLGFPRKGFFCTLGFSLRAVGYLPKSVPKFEIAHSSL